MIRGGGCGAIRAGMSRAAVSFLFLAGLIGLRPADLYWFDDRVWQVRFDHRFEGPVMGIRFGYGRSEVEGLLGQPAYSDEESLVFELDGTPFPVRVGVFFLEDGVHDIYIYRGDF